MVAVSPRSGQFPRQQRRGMDIAARRNAYQQRLFARQAAHHAVGVFGFDPEVAIGQALIVETRHNGGGHVLETFEPMESARRLRGDRP